MNAVGDNFCITGNYDIPLNSINDMSDYLAVIGDCFLTLLSHPFDERLFGKSAIRFYKNGEPGMVLTGDVEFLEVINGIKDYEQIEFNLIVNPNVMAGMESYSVVFPTRYDNTGNGITFNAIGVFDDTPDAREKGEDIMRCMIDIIQTILLNDE